MHDSLPIDEVVRRTGLTARALRFYEARGLIAPLRTSGGRRYYSSTQLERLHRIVSLKGAGFSLAEIARLLGGQKVDAAAVLRIQIAALADQREKIESASALLRQTLSRIEGGEPLDGATLCSLIREGETIMTMKKQWDTLSEAYMSDQARADFVAASYPPGFDQSAYSARWEALGARIKAALPLNPASEAAQSLLNEWQALLAPFTAIATPAMTKDVKTMYDDMPNWDEGAPSPGFDHEVWAFIKMAASAKPRD